LERERRERERRERGERERRERGEREERERERKKETMKKSFASLFPTLPSTHLSTENFCFHLCTSFFFSQVPIFRGNVGIAKGRNFLSYVPTRALLSSRYIFKPTFLRN
jgi:hypothetical protein